MSAESAVRLSNVSKQFGEKLAVDSVSLDVPRGAIFGLIGPNGAGKTTTFSMLAGYLLPSAGIVEVLGFSPRKVDALRGKLGVLPQDALLPAADTVGQFLLHMARIQGMNSADASSQARAALAEVDGNDWWSARCGGLSHGMSKRVSLAQALLGTPEVILLDEPTAGLDPRVAFEVRQIIKSRRGRSTMIVSSHNLKELEEICDGAAVLDHGKLVAVGSIGELTAASEEVHIQLASTDVPLERVQALPLVARAEFDTATRVLVVYFDRQKGDAETVIAAVLPLLLQANSRISGVSKGRGLEQRVMELT